MTADAAPQITNRFWNALSFLTALAVVAALGSRTFVADSLMGLYLGRYIDAHGIPHVDDLTTNGAGLDWIDQQWLAQVLSYGSWSIGGYTLAAMVSAVALAAAFLVLSMILLHRGTPGIQAFAWVGVTLAVTLNNTFIRAQSIAVLLFVLVLLLLLRDEEQERFRPGIWVGILLLLAVWANIHGSLLLTIPAVSAWAVWRAFRARRTHGRDALGWLGAAILAPLMILVTPYGIDIVDYYRSVLGNDTIGSFITEWQPAMFTAKGSIPFLLYLLATIGTCGFVLGRGRRLPLLPTALAVWYMGVGTLALRYHIWGAFPATILLASIVRLPTSDAPDQVARARRLLTPVLVALVVGNAAIIVGLARQDEKQWLSTIPVEQVDAAAQWLDDNPDSTILADDPTSPALLWLHPEQATGRVAFDARLEHFREQDLRSFFIFVEAYGPEWLDIADGHDAILMSKLYHPRAVELMDDEPGWRIESKSRYGRLYVRDDA
ncbi:MAG: hypothetical protein KDC46_07255 [Thermoleophilia bacterium]|nr:hypothetical protein [Thermoleophilia bacterium]